MKLILSVAFLGLFLSIASAQDIGVPGVFEFHGPLSQSWDHNDWRTDRDRWNKEFRAHRRYWRGDVWMCPVRGGWEECE
jgi:hypothetical protein